MSTPPEYRPDAGPSKPRATHHDLHHLSPEIIIIGAGIAGTALSYSLAAQGRQVLLLERDLTEPDRIVGELLQPGGVAALTKLGLGGCLEGIDAVGVEGYCVVSGERRVGIPYPALGGMIKDGDVERIENGLGYSDKKYDGKVPETLQQEMDHWHVKSLSGKKEGRSFHHGRLIASLRSACSGAPNLTMLEATVRNLIYCDHTTRVIGVEVAFKVQDGEAEPNTVIKKVYAPITIVADGCFSKFRGLPGSKVPKPQTRSHFVGVVIKDLDLPMPRHGTVCLTPAGPVLLYQIADQARETRMLVDVKGRLPNGDGALKNHLLSRYLPHLPPSLQPNIGSAISNQRLRTMPNSFLPPSIQGSPSSSSLKGVILVGDAWNMRHPLTGGGMTVAFNDAVLLTEILKPSESLPLGREGLENWEVIAEGLRGWFWDRKGLAGTINVLSMALYDLFGGADAPDLEILREGCFRYFELGGECVAGPVGLLSALTPKPFILFYHFFSVALYSIYILFVYGPPPPPGQKAQNGHVGLMEIPGRTLLSARVFWTACVVLLPVIWTEFQT